MFFIYPDIASENSEPLIADFGFCDFSLLYQRKQRNNLQTLELACGQV